MVSRNEINIKLNASIASPLTIKLFNIYKETINITKVKLSEDCNVQLAL